MDFSVIKNLQLRELMANSDYFKAINEEEKRNFLQAISSFDEAEQKKMCVFFVKTKGANVQELEKEKDRMADLMDNFVEELQGVLREFKSTLIHEKEKVSTKSDEEAREDLLRQIDQC